MMACLILLAAWTPEVLAQCKSCLVEFSVAFPHTVKRTSIARVSLLTRADALTALDEATKTSKRVCAELGAIGSLQSRFSTALSALTISRDNYLSAASAITDVDVAQEAATMVRTQILQQAGVAILQQANIQPQIALQLLSNR